MSAKDQEATEKVISYVVTTADQQFSTSYHDVAEAFNEGYRLLDVISTPATNGTVVITVVLTRKSNLITPYKHFEKG